MRYALLIALAATLGLAPESQAWGKRHRGRGACCTTHASASAMYSGCEAAMMTPSCGGCGGGAAAFSSNAAFPAGVATWQAGTAYTLDPNYQRELADLQMRQQRELANLQQRFQNVGGQRPENPAVIGAPARMPYITDQPAAAAPPNK